MRAQVVGTGGRTDVTGPALRGKLGLYDTWARFTVITATATRGDGNTPPSVPATPARSPDRRRRAAAGARGVARRRDGALPAAGMLSGRVDPASRGAAG